jgi:outer membrane protein OmpA-like peptidoglycan-associated protein
MQTLRYAALSLVVAVAAGCATSPEHPALSEARTLYQGARSDPQTSRLAPLQLQEAGASLERADAALAQGESDEVVADLAYIARQKVAIARETAKRKAAEQAVSEASAERDRVRLAARTAEVEAARRQASQAQLSAREQAERDQAMLAAREAELEAMRREAQQAKEAADQHAMALAEMTARADRNEAAVAAKQAEAEAAREQAATAQRAAEQQAAALEAARAEAERARAQIAEQESQLKELNAQQTDRGLVITLGDVLFGVGKSQLTSGGMRNVQKLASFLNQYPDRKVMIEGHTDSTGSDALNQALSERRAGAVRDALVGMGIGSDRIETRGYGKAFPIASNNSPGGRQLNRRVEIVVSNVNETVAPRTP